MMTLDEAVKKVRPLDEKAMEGARKRWDSIAKPLHSLGELENMLTQIAGITGTPEVRVEKKAVVAMCADNGVVEEGVTQTGQEAVSYTHLIKKGMSKAQTEEELAVKCGYWHNFRFNPAAENKFSLDSKTPDMENYMDFLNGEVRYNSLQRQNPEKAARLFAKNESEAQARYEYLQKLITLYGADKKED